MAELEDGDPFKEFGGSVVAKTKEEKNPFAEFGGEELKKKIKSDTGGQSSVIGSDNPLNPARVRMPGSFNFAQQVNPDMYNKVQKTQQDLQKAQSKRLQEINKTYDAAQGEGTSASIRAGLDEAARNRITPTESSMNSVKNMVNRLQGTIPRLNIVAADTWENVLGDELARKWYEFEGRDIDQVRNDAYEELGRLSQEVLPTLSLTSSIQDGSIKNVAAGITNAVTSLGSSALPAIATGGAGIFTEMTGDALVDFNNAKAKRLGMTVPELYETNQAEFGIPATIGALGGSLELVGLKGIQKMMTKDLVGGSFKKAAILFGVNSQKEGVTEWLQTGLEEANRALGAGKSLEDASKQMWNKMKSKEGLESYLQGVAGAAGAGALGRVGKSLISPKAKMSFNEEVAKVDMMEMDLRNPEIDEATKETIASEVDKSIGNMADIIEEDNKAEEKLTPEQRVEAVKVNENIDELQTIIDNPNVSESTKKVIQEQIDELNKRAETLAPETTTEIVSTPIKKSSDTQIDDVVELEDGKKGKVTGIDGNMITMELDNGAILTANPSFVEMSVVKPIEAAQPTEVSKPIETANQEKEVVVEAVNEEVAELQDMITQAEEIAVQHEQLAEIETDPVEKAEALEIARNAREVIEKSEQELLEISNEETAVEPTEEVVEEDVYQKRNEEILAKAEDDLKALKQVENKVKKYEAMTKRITEAKNNKEITVAQFNDLKKRFDEVIGESKPKVKEETTDAIQEPKTETIPVESKAGVSKEVGGRNEVKKEAGSTEEKVLAIQNKRQAIKDRISKKLKDQRSNISSGFDPSLLKDFVELGSTYIEEGVVNAADFIKRFREDYKELGFDDSAITDEQITNEIFNKSRPEEQIEQESLEADIKEIGLTKDDVIALRDQLGQEQYTYEIKNSAERVREAKKAIKEGYNVADLIKKLNDRPNATALEVEILKQYYASLTTAIGKNPTPELIKQRDDLLKTIDVVKTEGGRASQAWDGLTTLEDNLANFLTQESQFTTLTQAEINELTSKYNKAKEALEQYQKKQEEALAKAIDKKAKEELAKAKKEASSKSTTKQQFKEERKQYVADFRAKLREIRTTPSAVILPYQRELIALAPFVRKMVQSYVNEGIHDLKTITKGIHEEFVGDIPELTEQDIKDIIAGQHKNTRETKNAKLAQIRDIERQAKLERKIEDLEQGIIETRNPVQKKKKSDLIAALEEEIKQIKKRNPELEAPIKLEARKKWFTTKIEQLKKQIRDGDYETIEEPIPVLLDQEALRLKDEYMKFKEETRRRRDKLEYDASSKYQKALDKFRQVLELRRLVQTSMDLSIPLRQGISVMMNPRTTNIGIDAYERMLKAVGSKDNYNRLMFDIEHSPEYLESKEDGIVYAEVGSTGNENRDEYHRQSFLYDIPYLRAPFMASERAASAWQNYARYQLYLRGVQMLEAQGKTRENSKKAYEQMAARVMVDTGRGKLPNISDKTSSAEGKFLKQLAGNTLYGARLASAIFRKLNPLYFFNPKVDKSVRVQALKDMAGYTTGLLVTGLAFAAMGYTVSFDYDDPDFLKARKGKKVIDFTGGQSTYVRLYLRLLNAIYNRVDPDISHEDANKYADFADKSLRTFFRNKLAPNTSYAVNMFKGENTIGEKFNPWEILQIYPMYTSDVVKSLKEGTPLDLLTIVPVSISGLGYMEYDKDVRRANLNTHLDNKEDKKVVSFLKSHKLNLKGDINQEIYDINTGDKVRMTPQQSDRFEKIWADYIKDELKEPGEVASLSKLNDKDLKKEINRIKLEANKYAKSQITGLAEGITTIREDDKTYELTPEQVKQRIKLNKEYIDEYGSELKSDLIEKYTDEGMSKGKAKRKAELDIQRKANTYSKNVMIGEEKDKNDGKITFKEKE